MTAEPAPRRGRARAIGRGTVPRPTAEDEAADLILREFDAVEEPDYVTRSAIESAAFTAPQRRALRRSIEAVRGMTVIRAQEVEA